MNLYSLLARGFPEDLRRPAQFFDDGTCLSYDDLTIQSALAAGLLRSRGVGIGDRIMVQAPKSPSFLPLYLGVLMCGAIFVPLNTAYTASEVELLRADAQPSLIITDATAFLAEAHEASPLDRPTARAPEDVAAIVYTSGTTGRPKGAMLTHGGLGSNATALTGLWKFSRHDVLLHALPVFHVHGLFVATHCALLAGCPMIWMERFSVQEVVAALPRATVMMGVPTHYTRLLERPDFNRELTRHIRLFVSGSAPLLESTFREFEARTGQRVLERYGMSEAAIITSNPTEGERRAGSVGFALPGFDLRIAGDAPGPIEIRGPSLFSGYWRMPEKTAEEFTDDGFFKTGDVGYLDADGRLYISGRAKDLIISGGYNVYPKEVEMVLDEIPGVEESAVIGVPHGDLGEAVIAVATGDGMEAAILKAARTELAGYKTPKRVIMVATLPRNSMGKVQKADLRREYADVLCGNDVRAEIQPSNRGVPE